MRPRHLVVEGVGLYALVGQDVPLYDGDVQVEDLDPVLDPRFEQPVHAEQVALIREHLKKEAAAFRRGDLSDPSQIHGEQMPGLNELEAGAKEIDIRYSDLPNGAKIEYETSDPALVAALHDWFDAQLSDHGDHAVEGDSGAYGHPSDHEGHNGEQHTIDGE